MVCLPVTSKHKTPSEHLSSSLKRWLMLLIQQPHTHKVPI